MTTISAQVILASRNVADPDSNRKLVTFLLRYPRCIHSEMMTHRAFSRNAASSRAIPVGKMIQSVIDDPFVPLYWGANQKGMQADEECNEWVNWYRLGADDASPCAGPAETAWLEAMHNAVIMARAFSKAGYHKQIVNRLLEPFSHITVVATATELDNFFALRDHPAAEPHIRWLAQRMHTAMDDAPVQELRPGEWHLPFISERDKTDAIKRHYDDGEETRRAATKDAGPLWQWYGFGELRKLSVARCASTSYKTVDGFDMSLERAIALHDKLISETPMHASPLEHQAQADHCFSTGEWNDQRQHRNFVGWRQYRAMVENKHV